MFRYEIQKLFQSKFIIISLTLALLTNFLLIIYLNKDCKYISEDDMSELIREYYSDPVVVDSYYEQITSVAYQQTNIDSLILFDNLYNRINYINKYDPSLDKIISAAQNTIKEYNNSEIRPESYSYRYQTNLIKIYTELKNNTKIGLEFSRGWDSFFTYQPVDIFAFLIIIVVSSYIFVVELRCDTTLLLRSSKNGRIKLAICKILCLILSVIFITLFFIITTWLAFGLIYGYSSINNAIQVFDVFLYCPFSLTVGGYLIHFIVFKLIAYTFFALVVMVLSIFIRNYAVLCLSTICIYLVNIALNNFKYTNTYNPLKFINLISTSAVTPLYERYRAFNIFGKLADATTFTITLYLLAILLCVILIPHLYCRFFVQSAVNKSFLAKKVHILSARISKLYSITSKTHLMDIYPKSMSLIGHEYFKTIIVTKYIFILILLVAIKVIWTNISLQSIDSYSENTYQNYMMVLSQKTISEQEKFIIKERNRIDSAIEKYDEMNSLYIDGEISLDEYSQYLAEYNYAYFNSSIFSTIEWHKHYINQMVSKGYNADFVYDTGWKQLFFESFDWTFFVAIILICSGIFSCEYDKGLSGEGVAQILRTTKYGRNRTLRNKYLIIILSSVALFLIWNSINIVKVMTNYKLPCADAPIQSLESFSEFLPHISITEYLIYFYLTKLLAAVILASFAFALSAIIHKPITVIIVVSIFTISPSLLETFGVSTLSKISFADFMSATPMLMRNLYAITYFISCTVICVLFNYYARKVWNHGVKY